MTYTINKAIYSSKEIAFRDYLSSHELNVLKSLGVNGLTINRALIVNCSKKLKNKLELLNQKFIINLYENNTPAHH